MYSITILMKSALLCTVLTAGQRGKRITNLVSAFPLTTILPGGAQGAHSLFAFGISNVLYVIHAAIQRQA